jgi:hypothetical protein
MAMLNTHAVVKKFTQHGFTEEHPELIVDAINDRATNYDIAMLKTELKANITELRTDIRNLKLKLESKIESINSNLESIKTNIKWIIAIGLLIWGILVIIYLLPLVYQLK